MGEQHRSLAALIREQVDDVLRTNRFILRPKVEEFEEAIRRYTGAQFAVGVSSDTDALLAILMALGIGGGDAVVTTPYSFFATAGCIARVGATPLFVDIDSETFNLSPRALEEFLQSKCTRTSVDTMCDGKKIRAIMPVYLFGLCCQMEEIRASAETYRLAIIEDAAQAIGAEYPSRSGRQQTGAMGHGGFFSFYLSKDLGATVTPG